MILQLNDILRKLKIDNLEESGKIFNLLVNFFIYMNVNDEIQTSYANFKKIDNNLLFLDTKINSEEIIDSLEKTRIIKIVG